MAGGLEANKLLCMKELYRTRKEPTDYSSALRDKLIRCECMKELFSARQNAVMAEHECEEPIIDWKTCRKPDPSTTMWIDEVDAASSVLKKKRPASPGKIC